VLARRSRRPHVETTIDPRPSGDGIHGPNWTHSTQLEGQHSRQRRKGHSATEQGGNKQGTHRLHKKRGHRRFHMGKEGRTIERGQQGGGPTGILIFKPHSCDFIYSFHKRKQFKTSALGKTSVFGGKGQRKAGRGSVSFRTTKSIGSAPGLCCVALHVL
jgi:hypothetical protein